MTTLDYLRLDLATQQTLDDILPRSRESGDAAVGAYARATQKAGEDTDAAPLSEELQGFVLSRQYKVPVPTAVYQRWRRDVRMVSPIGEQSRLAVPLRRVAEGQAKRAVRPLRYLSLAAVAVSLIAAARALALLTGRADRYTIATLVAVLGFGFVGVLAEVARSKLLRALLK